MPATPVQLPFSQSFQARDGDPTKDSGMKNLWSEARADGMWAVKRSGLSLLNASGLTGGVSLGIISVSSLPFQIVQQGPNAYAIYSDGSTNTITPWAGGKWFSWIEVAGYTNVIAQDTTTGYTIGGAPPAALTFTQIGSMPPFLCPGIAYLDGIWYVLSANDRQVHGSALNDPTTWPALNVVGAVNTYGFASAIIRHLNYILAVYEFGIQAFYDAGLAPPGSPLAPVPNVSFLIGSPAGTSVVNADDTVIFIGQSAARDIGVYQLSGLSIAKVSVPWVDKILQLNTASLVNSNPSSVTPNFPTTAYTLIDKGQLFYVIRIDGVISLAMNVYTKEWQQWSSTISGVEGPFVAKTAWKNYIAGVDLAMSQMLPTVYTDYTGPIACEMRTFPMDSQTAYRKFMRKLSLWGNTIPDKILCDYSNDDYATYSTAFAIDLSQQRKMYNRLGSYYIRSLRFRYSGNYLLEIRAVECLVEMGSA